MANRHVKSWATSLVIREAAVISTLSLLFKPIKTAMTEKVEVLLTRACRDWHFHILLVGIWRAAPNLSIPTKELKKETQMLAQFRIILFTTANGQKEPVSIRWKANQMTPGHITEYYSETRGLGSNPTQTWRRRQANTWSQFRDRPRIHESYKRIQRLLEKEGSMEQLCFWLQPLYAEIKVFEKQWWES